MDLQQCWTTYLKAEKLTEQGHWPEAHYLYDQVLNHLPTHLQEALLDDETKACQFSGLIRGLSDAAISQAEILNRMGQQRQAFELINQTYAQLQFLSIESFELVQTTLFVIQSQCEDLLRYLGAFCSAQRSAKWMLEFEHVQRSHDFFTNLQQCHSYKDSSHLIN